MAANPFVLQHDFTTDYNNVYNLQPSVSLEEGT